MTKHKMNLQAKYYDFIKNGTKRIELRLYDEKRRKIKPGDEIEFAKSEADKFMTKVTALYLYRNFAELVADFSIELLADKSMTKEELLLALDEFYGQDEQEEFGVVGVKLELI